MGDVDKAVEDCKVRATALSITPGKKDIILDPTNMWLTIHESCGHPTELDRALGFEANYAGTSFMTPDKLGKLHYGSEHINMVADRTQKDGLATRGYDDDGVKTTQWNLVKEGLFVGYQTTREMAGYINEKASNACAYADSWSHFPIQRMPNVSLQPGKKKLSLNDLIADTEDGIYIIGNGSWSIDMQRYNFQFTGQTFWEIKNGKITQMLRDVAYQGNTVDFWNSCDAVCDESEYKLGGSFFCGKGEPGQVSPVSHGCAPARFRKVNILNTSKESGK
jgi:TldD protein